MPFNVEYTLSVLRCKKRPLTDDEKEAVAASESIDVKYPRQTAEEVKATLERIANGAVAEEDPATDSEAVSDLTA